GLGADTFVYVTGGGADTITDFNHGEGDKIDLTGVGSVHTLSDIQAIATQNGADTFINFGGGNTLTLTNVTAGNLVAGDFVFSAPPANAAPTNILLSGTAIGENTPTGAVIGALSAIDPDVGDTATFTLTS